jgi:hypothetical protein
MGHATPLQDCNSLFEETAIYMIGLCVCNMFCHEVGDIYSYETLLSICQSTSWLHPDSLPYSHLSFCYFLFKGSYMQNFHWVAWASSRYRIASQTQYALFNIDISYCIYLTTCMLLLRPATLNLTLLCDISYVLVWNTKPWNLRQTAQVSAVPYSNV